MGTGGMSQLLRSVEQIFADDDKQQRLSHLSSLLLELKASNRDAYLKLKDIKRSVHLERSQFDERAIALQNVQYERIHLESEIKECQSYPSKYDKLDLLPVENIMLPDGLDEHQTMLARLNDELARRKSILEEVKLAEIRKDAEKDKYLKLLKELENLRDHARTIYKMACSYKLATGVTKPETVKKAPLHRLLDELNTFAGEREGWKIELCPSTSDKGTTEEEDGALPDEGEVEEGEKRETGHIRYAATVSQSKRYFDHEYVEVAPSSDCFNGTILFYHQFPSDPSSPVLITIAMDQLDNCQGFLQKLPMDASMLLTESSMDTENAVAFKWVQAISGISSDLSFSDPQRCLDAFFTALSDKEPSDQAMQVET